MEKDRFEPDEEDFEDDTDTCPYCQEAIYDDSVRCPSCGNYLSGEDAPSRPPLWIVIAVIVCLAAVLMWIL